MEKSVLKNISKLLFVALLSVMVIGGCFEKEVEETQEEIQEKISNSFINLKDLESFNYELAVSGEAPAVESTEEVQFESFDLGLMGSINTKNKEDKRFSSEVSLIGENDKGEQAKLQVGVSFIGDFLYAKLIEIVNPFDDSATGLQAFVGVNYRVPVPPEFKQASLLSQFNLDWSNSENLTEDEKKLIEEFKAMFKKHNFLVYKKTYGKEKLKKETVFKYGVSLDKGKLVEFLKESNSLANDEDKMSETELNELASGISLLDFTGNIYISEDGMFRRIEGDFKVTIPDTDSMEMSLAIELSDLNKDIEVQIPENFVDFDPMMYLGMMGAASQMNMTAE
jgi:hypothetical protein